MRLADYLKDQKLSDADFGRLIGVERQAVHRYRLGQRFPGREVLQRIAEATAGQVTANDFVELNTAPEREGASS